MYKESVVIRNESGLHARPASIFVKEASTYDADVKIIKNDKEYNAKSIMGILSAAVAKGDRITVLAQGDNEEEAVKALVKLVQGKFGEE